MADVRLLTFDEVPEELFTRWDITGYQLNRHLLSRSLTGTPDVVVDIFTFPPGFIHHMHRHPHADMVMVPLTGTVQFVGEADHAMQFKAGQLLVIPRGNWHEFRNVSDAPAQVLHFFAGVGAVEEIGYEAYPGHLSAVR
ncbi:hypothetical protein A5707_15235 [Mycobacterium kyorinense]|uniref:Cupin type-2 domain-containing protein n=1 Tax=Mycobacterium kyorinense TaxID=487514 RepID=A0A1A2ZM62_9MYCO|nr:cupin domain-containing protein [Mycobacterium kyorinense]OBI50567.1 hypothetical protein A5707_15235 [Mycobacterium kyorinense]